MWRHHTGSEVMQPIATSIIGGMISSLIHIIIITPVIFLWMLRLSLHNLDKSP